MVISNFMSDMESGNTPIAFGDLSHYWIADRRLMTVKSLHKIYCLKIKLAIWLKLGLAQDLERKRP